LVVGVVVVLGGIAEATAFRPRNAIVYGGAGEVAPQDRARRIILRNLFIAVEQVERAGGVEGFGISVPDNDKRTLSMPAAPLMSVCHVRH
jgi:hypothetical protein